MAKAPSLHAFTALVPIAAAGALTVSSGAFASPVASLTLASRGGAPGTYSDVAPSPPHVALSRAHVATAPTHVAAAVRGVPCRRAKGTTTITHSRKARIFSDIATGNDYACLYSNGHPRLLSTIEHWEYKLVRFSGRYVAFVAFAEGSNAGIGVLNMDNGRIRKVREDEEVALAHPPPSECPSAIPHCSAVCPQVDSLVLKHDGAIAWIAVDFPASTTPGAGLTCGTSTPPSTEVRRYDRNGLGVLASGGGIAPDSLRLSGSELSWLDEGSRESAKLR